MSIPLRAVVPLAALRLRSSVAPAGKQALGVTGAVGYAKGDAESRHR